MPTPVVPAQVLIVMGVSGSGKTTVAKLLAQKLGWAFHDGDDFHPPENVAKMSQGIPLTDQDRAAWLAALAKLIGTELQAGRPAVLACSALKQIYRDQLSLDTRVQFVYLKGSYELILERMRQRGGHFMKPAMLASQFADLQEPAGAITVDVSLTPQEIVERVIDILHKK